MHGEDVDAPLADPKQDNDKWNSERDGNSGRVSTKVFQLKDGGRISMVSVYRTKKEDGDVEFIRSSLTLEFTEEGGTAQRWTCRIGK